jgi:hypothetical protein
VSHSTVNRTMQTLRAALYHVRDQHEEFLKPNLKFGITKEEATKREASEAEEAAFVDTLREDFHDIFAFALLSGIRETGLCTLERSRVDLGNAQVTFQSKRHRGDPPGFIRWETQALGPLEVALLTEIIAARHHPQIRLHVCRARQEGRQGRDRGRQRIREGQALPDHGRSADDAVAARSRQGRRSPAVRRQHQVA